MNYNKSASVEQRIHAIQSCVAITSLTLSVDLISYPPKLCLTGSLGTHLKGGT